MINKFIFYLIGRSGHDDILLNVIMEDRNDPAKYLSVKCSFLDGRGK